MAAKRTTKVSRETAEEAVRTLDDAARARLLESLKVDALAVMRVKYVIGDKSGMSIGGVGKACPIASKTELLV